MQKSDSKIIIKRADGSIRVATNNSLPSLAKQQFQEQSDVNHIMKKYKTTGIVTHINKKRGQYMDTTNLPDYQTALQTVIDAESSFKSLNSDIRKRFNNDPAELIKFLQDKNNKEEAIKLGLIEKPQENLNEIIKNDLNEIKTNLKTKHKNDKPQE